MESLRDKLKSLGVQIGTENLIAPQKKAEKFPVESIIEGHDLENALGNTFIVEKEFSAGYQHGNCDLGKFPDYSILSQWAKSTLLTNSNYKKVIFLDAETSGLSGGTGTFAFMLGLGHFTDSGFKVYQLFLRDPCQEPAFLSALSEYLQQFSVIVSYNGKSFDVPLMKNRYILHSESIPFESMEHIDLLHLARRIWRNRLASRTLGNLETEILNYARSQEEVPGWIIPELYFNYLKSQDARPLAGVFYHNQIDILSLAALFNILAEMLTNPLDNSSHSSLDLIAIARLYEELGYFDKALDIYEFSIQQGLPENFLIDTYKRYAKIFKSRAEWGKAIQLWERAVELQDLESCIEIAKYYEHTACNIPQALFWTDLANHLLEISSRISPSIKNDGFYKDLYKRKNRLVTKLQKSKGNGS